MADLFALVSVAAEAGGMISSTLLTLIVIPAIYAWVKEAALRQRN